MRRNLQLEAVLAELRGAGVVPRVLRGRHIQVCWTGSSGRELRCTVAGTPGDRRHGVANARAMVRRMLRQEEGACQ